MFNTLIDEHLFSLGILQLERKKVPDCKEKHKNCFLITTRHTEVSCQSLSHSRQLNSLDIPTYECKLLDTNDSKSNL